MLPAHTFGRSDVHHQVITIGKDGSISGLQRKPGQGIDLRQFGKADIQRASLIEWASDTQGWYINVLQEAGKGRVHAHNLKAAGIENAADDFPHVLGRHGCLYFAEYEDAVKVEIAYLDALRLSGRF